MAPKFDNVELIRKIKALKAISEIIKKCQKKSSGKDRSLCYVSNCGKLIENAEILIGTELFDCNFFELHIDEYLDAFDFIQSKIEELLNGFEDLFKVRFE